MNKRPNILFIYSDDTNHEMLGGPNGCSLTPNIEQLAVDGMRCTQFRTVASVCTPSRYAWLTGHYAGRCPNESWQGKQLADQPHCVRWDTRIDTELEKTLGHVLQNAGYLTGWVGKFHTGTRKYHSLVSADGRLDDPETAAQIAKHYEGLQREVRENGFEFAEAVCNGNPDDRPIKEWQTHNLDWMAHEAKNFLHQSTEDERPFFLNVATTTLHGPHHIAAGLDADPRITQAGLLDDHVGTLPDLAAIKERLEAAGIEYNHLTAGALWMDDLVGYLLKQLDELGLRENTIVIFSTDHGNHEIEKNFGKATCYESGVHIPFYIRWPGHIQAGAECDAALQNIDLIPTLADILAIDLPEDMVLDGVSMMPALLEDQKVRDTWFSEFGYSRSVQKGQWKLILNRLPQPLVDKMKNRESKWAYHHQGIEGSPGLSGISYPQYWEPDQLYDLAGDPDEKNNLAYDPVYCEKLAEMKEYLHGYTKTFRNPFPIDNVDPYLLSDEFRDLCKRSLEAFDPNEYYWYREGAY